MKKFTTAQAKTTYSKTVAGLVAPLYLPLLHTGKVGIL